MRASSKLLAASVTTFLLVVFVMIMFLGQPLPAGLASKKLQPISLRSNRIKSLPDVKRVELLGAFHASINSHSRQIIQLTKSDSQKPELNVEVTSSLMRITNANRVGVGKPVAFSLHLKHLQSLLLNGSSVVEARVAGEQFQLVTTGNNRVVLKGKVDHLSIQTQGQAVIDARQLQANQVTVLSAGAYTIQVNPKQRLIAQLYGVGNVQYLGNPQITRAIVGMANVLPLSEDRAQ